jgi:hypothetical protein
MVSNARAHVSDIRSELMKAAKLGRGGDDKIVHTNAAERAALKAMGGAGTINPKTGLQEFKYGGNVSEGGKKQGASESGGQGPRGGSGAFGGGSFGSGLTGRQTSAYGGSAAYGGGSQNRAGLNSDRIGGGSFGGQVPGAPTRDIVQAQDQLGANVAQAQNDYRGVGDSFIDKIGNFIASGFGLDEMDPTRPGFSQPGAPGTTQRADWGWDPIGTLAGLAGLATGYPIGTAYSAAKNLTGVTGPQINMGADVFGGDAPPGSPTADNIAARNASYMSGRSVKPGELSIQTASGTPPGSGTDATTGGMVGDNADVSSADRDFGANSSAVAASRSPFNPQIGGFSGGGYAMGRTRGGKKSASPKSLAEGLGRYRGPYDRPATVL